jgi:hypothetical protein
MRTNSASENSLRKLEAAKNDWIKEWQRLEGVRFLGSLGAGEYRRQLPVMRRRGHRINLIITNISQPSRTLAWLNRIDLALLVVP